MIKFSDKEWDGSASNYDGTPEYCDACLVNENEGDREEWTQERCKLPVKEPGGAYNRNAIRNAMGRIFQLKGVSPEAKRAAAKRLVSLAKAAGIEVGESVKRLAGVE